MFNKVLKWTFIIFAVIVILIYSEDILALAKQLKYKQNGYKICDSYTCMNEQMQTCQKAYLNITAGFKWVDMFVQGYQADKCVYQVNRYVGDGYSCIFDKEIFSKELVDQLFGVHNGLENTIIQNCHTLNN